MYLERANLSGRIEIIYLKGNKKKENWYFLFGGRPVGRAFRETPEK